MSRADADERIVEVISRFLNLCPDAITGEMLAEMCSDGLSAPEAYALLLCASVNADTMTERLLLRDSKRIFFESDAGTYEQETYLKKVPVPETEERNAALSFVAIKPFEAFPCGEMRAFEDGAVLPQISWFRRPARFPALFMDGRLYMSIVPNEILTIAPEAARARGSVLTLGLGMGYFIFKALENPAVETVTCVEQDERVINLFCSHIRPRLPRPEALTILQGDAFRLAPKLYAEEKFDFVFADLWHDAQDGPEMYLRLKRMERDVPGRIYSYWIENTLKYYI